jgi:glyoxylase-like metal-dependent hydrolase (beta-lactamase superfamily II)
MPNLMVPLEDELGDVLEKALRHAGLSEETAAERAGLGVNRILDAIDYRPDLSGDELRALAGVLGLNEIGLCALGCGRYPLPELPALPFCVHPLHMSHGIGVANAYLVSECGSSHGVLFDTGPGIEALELVWPKSIREVDAVFTTHVEAEHAGGLCAVVERFGVEAAFCPAGARAPCGRASGEGETWRAGPFEVTTFSTPGHCSAHNCYVVRSTRARAGVPLLISGDLLFAGSVGGAHFCERQLRLHLDRMLTAVPPETVIAPGHGPMTTVRNERQFNPFVV